MAGIRWDFSTHGKTQATLAGATELRVVDDPSGASTSKKTTLTALVAFIKTVIGLTPSDISGFDAAASAAAPVQSVAGRTGAVTLDHNDITDFNASASAAAPVQSVAGRIGTVTLTSADLSDFNEAAQDAIGAMIADTATIDLTYTDSTPELKADVKAASIDVAVHLLYSAASRLAGRGPTGTATEIQVLGGLEFNGAAIQIANNGVTDAKFRQSAGVSVPGRAANTTGNIADIIAGADGYVLRRTGGALNFGNVTDGMVLANTFNLTKLVNATQRAILGASAAGAWAETAVSADVWSLLGYANNAAILSGVGADAKYVLKAGDTMSGSLTISVPGGTANINLNGETAVSFDGFLYAAAAAPTYRLNRSRGTIASPSDVAVNDIISSINSRARLSGAFSVVSQQLVTVINATPSSTARDATWLLKLGNGSNLDNALYVTNLGAVGVGASADIVIDTNRLFRLRAYTVATLPSASGIAGALAYVTDSLAAPVYNATATGGGSTYAKVTSDGTNWKYG